MTEKTSATGGWSVYKRLLRYSASYWRVFLIAIVGMVIVALSQLLFAKFVEPMLDDTFVNTDSHRRDRMLEMMIEDDGGVQFILFTCHGDHYEAYRNREEVTMISLPYASG